MLALMTSSLVIWIGAMPTDITRYEILVYFVGPKNDCVNELKFSKEYCGTVQGWFRRNLFLLFQEKSFPAFCLSNKIRFFSSIIVVLNLMPFTLGREHTRGDLVIEVI